MMAVETRNGPRFATPIKSAVPLSGLIGWGMEMQVVLVVAGGRWGLRGGQGGGC